MDAGRTCLVGVHVVEAHELESVGLLIDHQSGLFQTVKDMEMTVQLANATTLDVSAADRELLESTRGVDTAGTAGLCPRLGNTEGHRGAERRSEKGRSVS
jgi:hypothetical protein